MQSPTKILPIFLFLLGLNGCLGRTAYNQLTGSPDSIEALHSRLSSVRGLKFVNEVPMVMETRERMADYIDNEVRQNMGKKTLEDVSLAYAKLGLLPRGVDLRASLLSFYSSQTLAFYDSRAKKVFLAANPDGGSGTAILGKADEKVMVHELTHALQDQEFSIGDRLRSSTNGDAAMALRSVAEGDAVLTEYAYSFGGLHEWLPNHVRQVLDSTDGDSILPNIPMIVADKTRFQYLAGARFVSRFLGKWGSWISVNLLYEYPPLSTEQILHPEKYSEVPDPPTRITLKSLSGVFSAEWKEIENDTLGELMVQCLFKQFLNPGDAAVVANGWDGDRFIAYRRGDQVAFIWATIWDSSRDAQEFFDNYQTVVSMKYDSRPLEQARFYIEKRDQAVLIVEGLDREHVKGLIETVWRGMEVKEAPFQLPPLGTLANIR